MVSDSADSTVGQVLHPLGNTCKLSVNMIIGTGWFRTPVKKAFEKVSNVLGLHDLKMFIKVILIHCMLDVCVIFAPLLSAWNEKAWLLLWRETKLFLMIIKA